MLSSVRTHCERHRWVKIWKTTCQEVKQSTVFLKMINSIFQILLCLNSLLLRISANVATKQVCVSFLNLIFNWNRKIRKWLNYLLCLWQFMTRILANKHTDLLGPSPGISCSSRGRPPELLFAAIALFLGLLGRADRYGGGAVAGQPISVILPVCCSGRAGGS